MDSTTKTAALVAIGALVLLIGYILGKQAGESNRFELSRDNNYLLDRSNGRVWVLGGTNTDNAWLLQAEPPRISHR